MKLYAKRKAGFHNMRPERARALSCRGTRTVVELANDYAYTYAPFIQAAVREVGHSYWQVATWLTREQIPAQRAGQWKAQSVKNLVVRYWRLTGRRILSPLQEVPGASAPSQTPLRGPLYDRRHLSTPFAGARTHELVRTV
jgi:hypothetical protein